MKFVKRDTPSGVPLPTPFAVSLLKRLVIFNVSSVVVFMGLLLYSMQDLKSAELRIDQLPEGFRKVFIGFWIVSTLYRLYLNRVESIKVKEIALNDERLISYAWRQVVSTLLSAGFVVAACLYASGILVPVVHRITEHFNSLDKNTVETWLTVATTLFWGIVTNALWDFLKQIFRRAIPDKASNA